MPLVSVVIPTYKRSAVVARAIQSVLYQTFKDFEIIVVDDYSQDNTENVVKEINDSRIVYTAHDSNRGGGASRNTGIQKARGTYIAFLDSDDEWLPEKLEKQISVMKQQSPCVGVVYTGYWMIVDGLPMLGRIPRDRGDIFEKELFADCVNPTSCVLIKKECFEKVGGFSDNLPVRQDYDMWLRVSKFFQFEYIRDPLAKIYLGKDSVRLTTASSEKHIYAEEYIIEKIQPEIQSWSYWKQKKCIAHHYYVLGRRLCMNHDVRMGRKYFFSSLILYPFSLNKLFFLFLSLLGSRLYIYLLQLYRRTRKYLL